MVLLNVTIHKELGLFNDFSLLKPNSWSFYSAIKKNNLAFKLLSTVIELDKTIF